MATRSLYYQLRQIEMMARRIQPEADADRPVLNAVQQLQKRASMAVITVRDYENFSLEEDTKGQLRILPKVVKSLEQLREAILKASEYDLIGAVDVAQTSAHIDELIDRLR